VGFTDALSHTSHPSILAHSLLSASWHTNVAGPIRTYQHHDLFQLLGFIDLLGLTYKLFMWAHPCFSSTQCNSVIGPIWVHRHHILFEALGLIDAFRQTYHLSLLLPFISFDSMLCQCHWPHSNASVAIVWRFVGFADASGLMYRPSILAHSLHSTAPCGNVTGPIRVLRHHVLFELVGFIDALGPICHWFMWAHPYVSWGQYNIVTGPIQVPRCHISFFSCGLNR
jgi:hypothetical protein